MADDMMILGPQGRLDGTSGPAVEADITKAIAAGKGKLLLDLTALDYVSSAGLRIVLQAAKQIKARGGRLVLCGLNAQIRDIFEISGFAAILEIVPTRDEAIQRLSA